MIRHLPRFWRYRLLAKLHAFPTRNNLKLLHYWQVCEGGSASFNPLNTTEDWPGATQYNPDGVKNYPSGKVGIQATYLTLVNGHYNGIVGGMRARVAAKTIVTKYADEFDTWGTGTTCILRELV